MNEVKNVGEGNRDASARWLGWIGIIAGIISFFYASFLFGAVAILLGFITVFSKANTLGWWSIGLGIVGLIIHWFIYSPLYY